MSKALNPEKALIFRIMHRDNFAQVLADGCHCRSSCGGGQYVEIGNKELIEKRGSRTVPCHPHGTLADYVPFYFTPYTPMLYNIKTGYNGIRKQPMENIIILVSSLRILEEQGITFVFSDRHAYLKTAEFSSNLADLERMICWDALQARNFKKDDVERFEKYQAEALVYKHVPLSAISGVVCYNDSVKAELQSAAEEKDVSLKIVAKPGWYV